MLSDVSVKETESVFKTPILQQTAFWSEVKKRMGIRSAAFDFKVKSSDIYNDPVRTNYVVSDLLVIIHQLDQNNSYAYVPYGPELEPTSENQGVFLEELSEVLRSFLPKNCIMIRYDLSWESCWAKEEDYYDSSGLWTGPPGRSIQELRFNFNTVKWNFRKTSSNILPTNTVYLNLRKDPQHLLEKMKSKTRYNIGLALRKGVNVKTVGIENLEVWYKLYEETALRNRFHLHNIEYFRAILSARADSTQSPAEVMLLIAEFENMPLAAMFLVISGNRGTYLYGASSSENKNMMAPYALQWKALNIAKEKGCTEYDMFGVAPIPDPSHPLYGLYRFKTGFGGELYHTMGCWDYPFDIGKYSVFTALELQDQGYHIN